MKFKCLFRKFKMQLALAGCLLIQLVLFIVGSPKTFLSPHVYISFMSTIPFMTIMALSLTLVVICGEIDFSFPAVMSFSTWAFTTTGNIYSGMLVALITGLIAGFLNGVLVGKIRIPSLIATLGTMFFWRGLVMVCTQGWGMTLVPFKETILFNILVGRVMGVTPAQALWAVILAVIFWLILNRHKIGADIYFVGDNVESAKMMGIAVDKIKILVFTQMGLFASLAGIIVSLEVMYYWPTLGEGSLLPTCAAVFLGGTSIFGGTGTIFGTFIGTVIIGILEAGIIAIGLTGFWTQMVFGLILVISVIIHSLLRRR